MSFEDNIKNWVVLDNKIREQSEELRLLKEERNESANYINRFVQERNLQSTVVEISDGKLRFATAKTSQPLTFKYIEECLGDIISDKNQVERIINYIKNKREIKYSQDIKRYYSN